VTGNPGAPFARTQQCAQHAYDRRFARPVWTEEAIDLTRSDIEIDPVNRDMRTESPNETFGANCGVRPDRFDFGQVSGGF
jgi:hypothetical protein